MNHKVTWLSGIIRLKCPRCREGKMFPVGTLYSPTQFMKMKKSCSCCGLSFEPEPGYYFGAMFISYAFNTAYFVGVWIMLSLFSEKASLFMMLGVLCLVVIGLLPITFRLSRVLWISIFVGYDRAFRRMD
jgi:uncharacterized protein (DUF983 family)